jgi:putative addiction module killer protein
MHAFSGDRFSEFPTFAQTCSALMYHLQISILQDTIVLTLSKQRSERYEPMNTINSTEDFDEWVDGLADRKARALIYIRIKRAELGNFGDSKPVQDGVLEMRIDFGSGYRVYYAREGRVVYLLLCGGDKSTQKADIKRAAAMWATIKKERP